MKEDTIRRFFDGEVDAGQLQVEVLRSVVRLNDIETNVAIEDMPNDFQLTRAHVLCLCDAGITGKLNQDALNTIAFALVASDRFEWDDEIISETLYDWACLEINLPLETRTLNMHRNWLIGTEQPAPKPPLAPASGRGRLILHRLKVRP